MRGRKPTPPELKILKGTRADRLPRGAPKPTGRPKCPAHLDATAKAEWRRMVPILERMRVLSEGDGAALAIYCQAFSRCREAERAVVDFGGVVILQENGILKRNPAEIVVAECEATMARILAEMGCTPSARNRAAVVAGAEGPMDDLGEFLAKRQKGGA